MYNAVHWYIVQCSTLKYIVQCSTLIHTVQCSTLKYIVQCSALKYTVKCSTLKYMVQCSTLICIVQCSTSINILFSSVCLFVFKNCHNATEPFGSNFCVGPRMTPRKVYGCSKLQKVVSKLIFIVQYIYAVH